MPDIPGTCQPSEHTPTTQVPPKRRKLWPWIAAGVLAVILGGIAVLAMNRGEDPGITACKQAAANATAGHSPTRAESDAQIKMLKGSSHEDLRQLGEEMERLIEDPSAFAPALSWGARFIAACAKRDIVVSSV